MHFWKWFPSGFELASPSQLPQTLAEARQREQRESEAPASVVRWWVQASLTPDPKQCNTIKSLLQASSWMIWVFFVLSTKTRVFIYGTKTRASAVWGDACQLCRFRASCGVHAATVSSFLAASRGVAYGCGQQLADMPSTMQNQCTFVHRPNHGMDMEMIVATIPMLNH